MFWSTRPPMIRTSDRCAAITQKLVQNWESLHHAQHEEAGRWALQYKQNPQAKKSSKKHCVCLACECLLYVCLRTHKLRRQSVFMRLRIFQYWFACNCDCNVCEGVYLWALMYMSLYTNQIQSSAHPHDIQNLSHFRREHSWHDWRRRQLAGCHLPV